MSGDKTSLEKLKTIIKKYSGMGNPFIYQGFCYHFDINGNICCVRKEDSNEKITVIFEGTQKISTPSVYPVIVTKTEYLVLPQSMRIIGKSALSFAMIKNINFGGTRRIKDSAFCCAALGSLVLPDTVQAIESRAFAGIRTDSVSLGAGLQQLGANAFGRAEITSIDMHRCSRLTQIHSDTFHGCSKLKTVQFPPNLEKLGRYAFAETAVTAVDMEELPVSVIPDFAFASCPYLTAVKLPRACRSIEPRAFYDCPYLKTLYIPEALNGIDTAVFSRRPELIYY